MWFLNFRLANYNVKQIVLTLLLFVSTSITYGSTVKFNEGDSVTSNVKKLRIREAASSKAKVIGRLEWGEKSFLVGISPDNDYIDGFDLPWFQIQKTSGLKGWVFGRYLTHFSPPINLKGENALERPVQPKFISNSIPDVETLPIPAGVKREGVNLLRLLKKREVPCRDSILSEGDGNDWTAPILIWQMSSSSPAWVIALQRAVGAPILLFDNDGNNIHSGCVHPGMYGNSWDFNLLNIDGAIAYSTFGVIYEPGEDDPPNLECDGHSYLKWNGLKFEYFYSDPVDILE